MKYFYIHPSKPQYFFPKGYKKHDLFLKFYVPFSLKGKIAWFLFNNLALYRCFFCKTNIEKSIPEFAIRSIVGKEPLIAFNTGSKGPEQKITALAIENNNEFFFKYGQTVIARENIINEHFILKQLSNLNFIPRVLDFYSDDTQVLLKTNVLKGERLQYEVIEKNTIDQLIIFSKQKVDCHKITTSNLLTSFSHGDFCPWNIMSNARNVLVFDWEMAGIYTLGYDLFTYIFQTCFLLDSETQIKNIVIKNIKAIEYYFSHFHLKNWKPYLTAFAEHKVNLEQSKGDNIMINNYLKLLKYAKEA